MRGGKVGEYVQKQANDSLVCRGWDLWMGFEERNPKGTLLDGLWKYFKWYID